jgi:hypothetical protein
MAFSEGMLKGCILVIGSLMWHTIVNWFQVSGCFCIKGVGSTLRNQLAATQRHDCNK